jgi:hypothetical protein
MKREAVYTLLFIFAAGFLWQLGCALAEVIETYAFCFEVEANNRVEAEEKAKEYVDKYQADKFFECATNRVFKIIPTIEGDKE